jgi:hypothetical protein
VCVCNQLYIFIRLHRTRMDHGSFSGSTHDQRPRPNQRSSAEPCGVLLPKWGTLSPALQTSQREKKKGKERLRIRQKKNTICKGSRPRLPPILPSPPPPSACGRSVAIWPTLVSRREARTALVALSPSRGGATLGALGRCHSQRAPVSFHISLI